MRVQCQTIYIFYTSVASFPGLPHKRYGISARQIEREKAWSETLCEVDA